MTDGPWFDLQDGNGGRSPGTPQQQRLDNFLRDSLVTENLVVLAGLGTSLGLKRLNSAGVEEDVPAPTMRRLFEEVQQLEGFDAAAAIATDAVDAGDVEALLSHCQFKIALDGDEAVQAFLQRAERTILSLCSFVDEATDLSIHELFLRKVARRQPRLGRTQIFTTNYDLAYEHAARSARFSVIDGFGFGGSQAFDGNAFDLDVVRRRRGEPLSLEPNVLHLLKLHGSVDWDEASGGVFRRDRPETPVLIYPSQNKFQLSFKAPYLESMSRFQIALRQPDVSIIVVGFGFNDAHIVAPIESAIRSNSGLRMIIVSPNLSTSSNPTIQRISRLIEAGDRRHVLIQATFDRLVRLLPDTSGRDDREVHEDRIDQSWT